MTAAPLPLTGPKLAHARHELRTPVNAIIGYAEMLLEDVDAEANPQTAEALQRLRKLGKELQVLITDYLDASRLESQPELHVDMLAEDVRRAMLPPAQHALKECAALAQRVAEPAIAPLLPDLDKIATATRRLLAMLDDPLQLGGAPAEIPHQAPFAEGAPTDDELPTSEEEYSEGRAGHILVVDDNQFNREILARGLHRQRHYFALAQNGRQALEMLDGGDFDLVLLDIMMPEMDGFEVLRRIKDDDRIKHVPVIMISALDQIDSVVRCIEMGAEDYLPKPFNPVLLKARVGACLEKKRLRDQELEYLRNVSEVTAVAADVEGGTFRPDALDGVARRPDSLGQLARVFQSMVREVKAREERLKQQVQQLRVEIDEGRKARQVAEITDTDYFQELQKRAQTLKGRRNQGEDV